MDKNKIIHNAYFASGCFWGTDGSQYLSCIFYTNEKEHSRIAIATRKYFKV